MLKNEKSPSKPQRVLVEHESRTTIALSTPAFLALAKRAGKSSYPLTVLEQVYCRGLLSSKYHPKNTPEQQAFQRVDSFIHEGRAYELDRDLIEGCPTVPNGKKHMYIIKNAIKHHEERNKPEENKPLEEDWASVVGAGLGKLAGHGVKSIFGRGQKKAVKSGSSAVDKAQAKIKKDKYAARQIHVTGGKVKTRPQQIAYRLTRAKSSQAIRARGQEQSEIRQKSPYMGKKERFAQKKPGAQYAGDPQTPEQKAASAARQKSMQAQHTGQGTWNPPYAMPKTGATKAPPGAGASEPQASMSAKDFNEFRKNNPNVPIRGMKRK